jgi:hypothetical protein
LSGSIKKKLNILNGQLDRLFPALLFFTATHALPRREGGFGGKEVPE